MPIVDTEKRAIECVYLDGYANNIVIRWDNVTHPVQSNKNLRFDWTWIDGDRPRLKNRFTFGFGNLIIIYLNSCERNPMILCGRLPAMRRMKWTRNSTWKEWKDSQEFFGSFHSSLFTSSSFDVHFQFHYNIQRLKRFLYFSLQLLFRKLMRLEKDSSIETSTIKQFFRFAVFKSGFSAFIFDFYIIDDLLFCALMSELSKCRKLLAL